MSWDPDDSYFSAHDIVAKQPVTVAGVTYIVNRYERWENDETQVHFAIAFPKSQPLPIYASGDSHEDNTFPSVAEVKQALASGKKYVLTPKDELEIKIDQLQHTLKWQTQAVRSSQCLVADTERAIPRAQEVAAQKHDQAKRQLVKAEAEVVHTETELTAAKAALALL